jgi:hypothetical protein
MTKRPVFPVTRELSPRMRMPLSSDIGLWGGGSPRLDPHRLHHQMCGEHQPRIGSSQHWGDRESW